MASMSSPGTTARAPGYPVIIPDVVVDRLRIYFKGDPAEKLVRPCKMFGGKSAVQSVADGERTWEQVLAEYEMLFSYEVTS